MPIFHPNRPFFRAISRIADVLGLSLLWVFLSLPVVTLGAASAALYAAVADCVRTGENGAFVRFFAVFRKSFRKTALSSLIWGAIWAGLYYGFRVLAFLASAGERAAVVQLVMFLILLIVPAGIVSWLYPLSARREARAIDQNLEAARLTFARLPATLLAVAATAAGAYLCWRYWVPVVAVPSLCALCHSFLMEPVFLREGITRQACGEE